MIPTDFGVTRSEVKVTVSLTGENLSDQLLDNAWVNELKPGIEVIDGQ